MFIAEAFRCFHLAGCRFYTGLGKFVEVACLLSFLLLMAFLGARPALAHPVSQGSMDIVVHADQIELNATVSLEEILVVTASAGKKNSAGMDAVREHGDYLLNHLHIHADGKLLAGKVAEVPLQSTGRLVYRLEYRLEGATAKRIEFKQDVLREYLFAPGNPWEASYIVRIGLKGHKPREGLLFTYRDPLLFDGYEAGGLEWMRTAGEFVRHGIQHIITGYDHLLFVGALVLAVTGWRDLVKVIAMFTLAHTLTLALSVLNILRMPSAVVEPMIAASIVAVAVQNIVWPERSRGRLRLMLAFGFGLFHGLGFAGGLLDAMSGMAIGSIALAIVAFSIGVEIGHLLVVLPVFCILKLLHKIDAEYPRLGPLTQCYGSALISVFGLAYFYSALQ